MPVCMANKTLHSHLPRLSSMRKIAFWPILTKKSSAALKIYFEMRIGWDWGGGDGMDGTVLQSQARPFGQGPGPFKPQPRPGPTKPQPVWTCPARPGPAPRRGVLRLWEWVELC
jgi:hypothetical protein